MRRAFLFSFIVLNCLFFQYTKAQNASIGTYPATTIAAAGGNAVINPSAVPANATTAISSTTVNFKGVLQVSPATGVVRITNAYPAGTYIITVKAVNGASVATTSFVLTVSNAACSQGLFSGSTDMSVSELDFRQPAIGDFNNDGKQDFAIACYRSSGSVAVYLGNGAGSFSATPRFGVYDYPEAVAVSDFNGDGKQDLAVLSDYQYRSYVSVFLGDGTGNFAFSTDVPVSSRGRALAVGDFNSDGKQDLVVSNGDSLLIRSGNGTGNFSGTTSVSITNGGLSMEVNDFNKDGKTDVALANYVVPGTVSILLGNGANNFTAAPLISVGNYPKTIVTADFNKDGNPDFATANYDDGTVSVRLGNGTGGFSQTPDISISASQYAVAALAAGDFNGDGNIDLGINKTGAITVLTGYGTGLFYYNTTVPVVYRSQTIAIADFNNDGRQDFIAAGSNSIRALSLCPGRAGNSVISVSGNGNGISNGDTTPSLADNTDLGSTGTSVSRNFSIQNSGNDTLIITSVNVSGTDAAMFSATGISLPARLPAGATAAFSVGFAPLNAGVKTAVISILNGDCNKNPFYYTVQATGTVTAPLLPVYPTGNTVATGGNTTVTPASSPNNAQSIIATTSANFRGTLTVNPATGVVYVTNASPAGNFIITLKSINGFSAATTSFPLTVSGAGTCSVPGKPALLTFSAGASATAIGDFNNDGRQDIVTTLATANAAAIRLGDGAGGFTSTTTVAVGPNPVSVAVADFNGDGKLDFITSNYASPGSVSVRLGDGAGGFTSTINFGIGTYPNMIALADFNKDGRIDFATANRENNTVSVRLGDGNGSFTGTTELTVGTSPRSLTVADVNNDGSTDILVANYSAIGTVSVQLGNGTGGFTAAAEVTAANGTNAVAVGDLDGDGNADLVTANLPNNTLSMCMGNGTGGFGVATTIPGGYQPRSVAFADFDADGRQDIIVSNREDTLTVWRNDGRGNLTRYSRLNANYGLLTIGDVNGDGKPDVLSTGSTVAVCLGSNNAIAVSGNGTAIPNGTTTPGTANYTEFGTVSGTVRTYTIRNNGQANLTISRISLTGADSTAFTTGGITFPKTLAADSTATFTITFSPATGGLKQTTVNVLNDDCSNGSYRFLIQGTGVVPALGNYAAPSGVTHGGNVVITPTAAPTDALKIVASATANFKGLLQINQTTGVVTITNATLAGTWLIKVTAYNGLLTTTRTFSLTVNNSPCSQGLFTNDTDFKINGRGSVVSIADFNTDGKQDLAVASDNGLLVFPGLGTGRFDSSTVAVGSLPIKSVAVGDINNDGIQDIVGISITAAGTVVSYLGNGEGHFTRIAETGLPASLYRVIVSDFNNDGNLDFAAVDFLRVFIRMGDGTGTFSGTTLYYSNCAVDLAVADFDADGKTDLAVSRSLDANLQANAVSVYKGDGTGGFSISAIMAVNGPGSIVTADFNKDGYADFATVGEGAGAVSVCLGNGNGTFKPVRSFSTYGSHPVRLATGDFNGDTYPDFIVSHFSSPFVSIGYGDGNGNFSIGSIAVRNASISVAVGDFDNDGFQDFATGHSISDTYYVDTICIRKGGTANIALEGNLQSINSGSTSPSTANGTDFGTTGSSMVRRFTIKNTGSAALKLNSIGVSGADSTQFSVLNTNLLSLVPPGDTTTFIIGFVPTTTGLKTTTIKISSTNCFTPLYTFAVQATGTSITPFLGAYPDTVVVVAGGDTAISAVATPANAPVLTASTSAGFTGTVHADPTTGKVFITNAAPAGTYSITVKAQGLATATRSFVLQVNAGLCSGIGAVSTLSAGYYPRSVTIADFNNDGKQDMALAVLTGTQLLNSKIVIWLGNGAGGFTQNDSIDMECGQTAPLSTADFNGDGNTDIAVGRNGGIYILQGNGTGSFVKDRFIDLPISTTALAAGDFNNDGKMDLLSGAQLRQAYLHLGNGIGGFTTLPNVSGNKYAWAVAVADINRDGKPDFITTGYSDDSVSLFLGNGDGSFLAAPGIPVASGSLAYSFADFNSDGNPDLIALSNDSASIRLGNGNGGFSSFITQKIESTATALTIGDFNGDGRLDFAVTTSNYGTTNILAVYYNDGAVGFSRSTKAPLASGTEAPLATGDFNGDGMLDIVSLGDRASVVSLFTGRAIAIALKGNNTLIAPDDSTPDSTNFTDFGTTNSLTRSFIIHNSGAAYLTINSVGISGSDSALFTVPGITTPFTLAPSASSTLAVKFQPGSEGLKIATVSISSNNCSIPLYRFAIQGTGITPVLGDYVASVTAVAGGNLTVTPLASPANAANITASAPIGFGGIVRVEQATGKVFITNAQPAGVYTIRVKVNGLTTPKSFKLIVTNPLCSKGLFIRSPNSTIGSIGNGARAIAVADFDGNGRQDFATANYSSNTVSIRYGNGAGSYDGSVNIPVGTNPISVAIADLNSDGWQDIAVANYGSNTVSVCFGDASGAFSNVISVPVGSNPQTVIIADFNQDDKLDFAAANYSGYAVSVRLGNGVGGFTVAPDAATAYAPYGLAAGDFNRDGKLDMIVTAGALASTVSVLLGNGAGGFSNTGTISGSGGRAVVAADFNNDSIPDFAALNGNNAVVYLNSGNATFTPSATLPGGSNGLATGDFNGDGRPDLAMPNTSSNYVAIRLGNGAGGFTAAPDVVVSGSTPSAVAVCDYNNDGRQDIIFPYYVVNLVAIRVNTASDINLKGFDINIVNGSTTTSRANGTYFGWLTVGSTANVTYTIQNTGNSDLVVNDIKITGRDSSQFSKSNLTFPLTIAAGGSTTFYGYYTPTSTGAKLAWLNILSDDCDEVLYRFTIRGGPDSASTLHFDGINDYVSINNTVGNVGNGDAAVSTWIKTAATIPMSIVSKGSACIGGGFIDIGINAIGQLSARFGQSTSDSQSVSGKKVVNDNVWHHVAVVRQGAALMLYVDGIIDTTAVFAGAADINNSSLLLLGTANCNGMGNFFSGQLDELKIYSRAISGAEIQSHIHCEVVGGQTSLQAYYKFNQGFARDNNVAITMLADSSGSGNNGLLSNFALAGIASNWIGPGPVVNGVTCTSTSMWLGITSAWNNPANWSNGFVPSELTNVIINTGVAWMPEITGNGVCYKITLGNGATIKIKTGGNLNVTGKN